MFQWKWVAAYTQVHSPFSSLFPFLLFSFPFLSFFSFSSPFPFSLSFSLSLSSSFPFLFSLPFPLFSFLSPFFPFPIFALLPDFWCPGGQSAPLPPLATPLTVSLLRFESFKNYHGNAVHWVCHFLTNDNDVILSTRSRSVLGQHYYYSTNPAEFMILGPRRSRSVAATEGNSSLCV